MAPAAPNTGIPNYSFQSPDFGPDLRGAAPGFKPPAKELRMAKDLILPRFRTQTNESSVGTAPSSQSDSWRYRYFNGRWWYWKPSNAWAYWDGSLWRARER